MIRIAALAVCLLAATGAVAQSDETLSTSSGARTAPPTAGPSGDPVISILDGQQFNLIEDAGPDIDRIGEVHGSVSAMVGTGGMYGGSAWLTTRPTENTRVDLHLNYYKGPGYVYPAPYADFAPIDPLASASE